MRLYTEYSTTPHLTFVGDTSEGTVVCCPLCKQDFVCTNQEHCPHCNGDITFGTWMDW